MSIFRGFALAAWCYGSLPWRVRRDAPVVILFYHRVADRYSNPWTISTRGFRTQIQWLRRRFDLVSLEEAQRRIRTGDSDRPAVAITFDDGYAENCEHALPLLIKLKVPCTYFVATRFVLEGRPFPHDVEAGTPLPVNTPEQIRALANAGIEIGAHTRTHIDLGSVTDCRVLKEEIAGAADDLAAITGLRPRYFAFPYGLHRNLNAEAFQVARGAGYDGVCSAFGGYNRLGGDPFHLQRFHGDTDLLRVKNWVSGDPRKAYTVLPFHYQQLPAESTRAEVKG
jgi:peptidoglycan/xylan/chitin deacetylase (PgdA/CDA1 family)